MQFFRLIGDSLNPTTDVQGWPPDLSHRWRARTPRADFDARRSMLVTSVFSLAYMG